MSFGFWHYFQDVLVQFAKMSQTEQRPDNKPPPYPEVTLHPVLAPQSPPHQSSSSSLLHGILTKSTNAGAASRPTTFSPTLARLLTAPERMPSSIANTTVTSFHHTSTAAVSISDLLSTSKVSISVLCWLSVNFNLSSSCMSLFLILCLLSSLSKNCN